MQRSPVGDALVLLQHAVIAGDGLGQVGQQRDVHGAQTSLFPRGVDPIGTQKQRGGGFIPHTKDVQQELLHLCSSSVANAKAITGLQLGCETSD